MTSLQNMIKSFRFALLGIRYVWREEGSFRVLCFFAVFAIFFGWYFSFLLYEWMVLAGCITMVLGAEMVNTAVEDLCNKVEPKRDPIIGKIKDIMAGFVLVVSFGALMIGVFMVANHFLLLG